jgi:hypothetical protein
MIMATRLNREQMRTAKTSAAAKQAAAPRRREASEPARETTGSRGKPTTYRFDLADIRSIAIERHSPLCLVIVVNPPKRN